MSRNRSIAWPIAVIATLVLSVGGARAFAGTAGPASPGTLAATAGCGKAPTLTSGTRTIQSNGKSRTYILRIPDGYDRTHPYRLIFGFHWYGGTAVDVDTGQTVQRDVWSYFGLKRLAGTSTIFVAPQGLNNGWANAGGEDLTFVDDMTRLIEGDLCVDTTQLFSIGFSYGGAMSYNLACARPTVFRAVVVQSGGPIGACNSTQPIPYLGTSGISDSGASGGRSARDTFVRLNGCTPANPPEPRAGSLTHTTFTYAGCRAGYPVEWAAFDGGHIAAPQDGAGGDNGTRTWVPAEVWKFFTQFGPSTPPTTAPPTTVPPTTAPPTTAPPTTAPPTTAPPTTPPPAGACRVSDTVSAWNTGLTSSVVITNTGGSPVDGWSLVFTLPAGQTITSGWNATYAPNSGQVTARNMAYNAAIAPGASVTIGFQANHTGNTAAPASFSLNGAACTTG